MTTLTGLPGNAGMTGLKIAVGTAPGGVCPPTSLEDQPADRVESRSGTRRTGRSPTCRDIEAFIAAAPGTGKSRLTVARQFFRFARNRRIVLVDPTRTLSDGSVRW